MKKNYFILIVPLLLVISLIFLYFIDIPAPSKLINEEIQLEIK